jgi:hypothetical protein
MKEIRKNLLALAHTFAKATGTPMTSVSRRFHGHQSFFEDFRAGRISIRLKGAEQMLQKFRTDWPEGTPWPDMEPVSMGRMDDRTLSKLDGELRGKEPRAS